MAASRLLTFAFVIALAVFVTDTAHAETIVLDNTGTGALLDGTTGAAGPFAVTEISGLNISVIGITGGGDLNVTAISMGINGPSDADTDAFEAAFSESVTFQFDKAVNVSQLDFTTFTAGETFNFGGTVINNGDLSNGTTDVYDFASTLNIPANTSFTLQATAGTIGIEAITLTVVSVVPEPSAMALATLGLLGLLGCVRRRTGGRLPV